ncbi:DMT family transporter [Vulgatibacter sp.]|uniref:DMT family transporter n=1 Tax=Vulgatibacter sp. TaxID=1971226 RepID=UPI003566A59C
MYKWLFVLLPILGGVAGGLQAPINGALGKRIGVFEAAAVSFTVGAAVGWLVKWVVGRGDMGRLAGAPLWQLVGGALGLVFVTSLIIAVPRTGAAVAIFAALLGQLAFVLLADHFGWLGLTKIPFGPGRAVGLVLMLAGVLLVYRSR